MKSEILRKPYPQMANNRKEQPAPHHETRPAPASSSLLRDIPVTLPPAPPPRPPVSSAGPVVQAKLRLGPADDDPAAIHDAARLGTSGTAGRLPHFETIQRSFGAHDISHIKAYTDGAAAAGATTVRADAFACGARQPLLVQRSLAPPVPATAPDAIRQAAALGTSGRSSALPYRDTIQRSFGHHSIMSVRAYTDDNAAAGARAMGAEAFTTGDRVAFADASPSLHTAAHEAAHVIQQRGDVQLRGGVGEVGDVYEQHADAVADLVVEGRSAEALLDRAGMTHVLPGEEHVPDVDVAHSVVQQRKSRFTSLTPKKRNADTPLKTLHTVFGAYFKTAKIAELYDFHSLNNIAPDAKTYGDNYDRAGKVEAIIDPRSCGKADGKNRNNTVITPYGHFGTMERACFGRQNLGNTYDGGHLVEHTLMEGQDADVHGNLAPQEAKHFNQGLMRGWEAYPEWLMHNGSEFGYEVELSYDADSYQRTGKDLLDAGVLPRMLEHKLDPTNQAKLEAETATFVRWIPFQWDAKVKEPSAGNLGTHTRKRGTHLDHIALSGDDAKNDVLTNALMPPLLRSNSGTLSGFIETLAASSHDPSQVFMGGMPTISATMFQPFPLSSTDQPTGTTNPKGAAVVLAPATVTTNLLTNPVSLSTMYDELKSLSTYGKKRKNKPGTILAKAKVASAEFRKLYADLKPLNAKAAAIFVEEVLKKDRLDPDVVAQIAQTIQGKDVNAASALFQVLYDPNLKA